jgi:hypothetical protein
MNINLGEELDDSVSVAASTTSSVRVTAVNKSKVWKITATYSKPLNGQFVISIHKSRKLRDVVDQIMEDLEDRINKGQMDTLLEIDSVYFTQNLGQTKLNDLAEKVENLFAHNSHIEIHFGETETISQLVSTSAKAMYEGVIGYSKSDKYSTIPSVTAIRKA